VWLRNDGVNLSQGVDVVPTEARAAPRRGGDPTGRALSRGNPGKHCSSRGAARAERRRRDAEKRKEEKPRRGKSKREKADTRKSEKRKSLDVVMRKRAPGVTFSCVVGFPFCVGSNVVSGLCYPLHGSNVVLGLLNRG